MGKASSLSTLLFVLTAPTPCSSEHPKSEASGHSSIVTCSPKHRNTWQWISAAVIVWEDPPALKFAFLGEEWVCSVTPAGQHVWEDQDNNLKANLTVLGKAQRIIMLNWGEFCAMAWPQMDGFLPELHSCSYKNTTCSWMSVQHVKDSTQLTATSFLIFNVHLGLLSSLLIIHANHK